MSYSIFPILILFIYFNGNIQAQNCTVLNGKQGECTPLKDCDPILNAFENNLVDDITREFLKTRGLCRLEADNPIVCCEIGVPKCITIEHKPGSCTPLESCSELIKYMKTNDFNDTALDYYRKSECEKFDRTKGVCCPIFPHPITGKIFKPPLKFNERQKVIFPVPGEGPGYCGIPADKRRIVNNHEASIYEAPWSVLLKYGNNKHYCGGSLIHPRYVLTAAHCVTGRQVAILRNVMSVTLGEYNTKTEFDCDNLGNCNSNRSIDIDVEEIIHHSDFVANEYKHNIALIRLKKPAPYTDFIRPICLMHRHLSLPPTPTLTLVGWGKTPNRSRSDVKLIEEISMYDFDKCQKIYAESNVELGKGQFCAGGKIDHYMCNDYGGTPVVSTTPKTFDITISYQLGITSIGPKDCDVKEVPDVFTDINEYIQWIDENTYE